MLSKLSDEQIKLMDKVKSELIGLLDKKIDENEAIKGVKWLYHISKLKEPVVVIVDSPLAIQYVCNVLYQVENQVRVQVRNQVRVQVRNQVENQVRDQVVNQVENQVWNQVWNQVRDQVWNQVENQVENQVRVQVRNQVENQFRVQVRNQVGNQVGNQVNNEKLQFYDFSYDSLWNIGWVSFYSFFKRISIVKVVNFDKYDKYIRSGVFMSVYLDGLVVMCKNPLYIRRDEKGRMSCTDGYAIEWGDGYGLHFVNGVYFEPELYEKVYVKKNISGKEIASMKNTEQKACVIEYVGYDKVLKEIGGVVTDRVVKEKVVNGKKVKLIDEVIDFKLDNVNCRVVKVQDHSTGKETFLGVPVEKETEKVRGAIAWTFGMNADEYNPVIET